MALTWGAFKEQALLFLSSSMASGDDWEWSQISDRPGFGYLAKKNVTRNAINVPSFPEVQGDEEIHDVSELTEMGDDQATLQYDTNQDLYLFDYHIVYSNTYQQPVLYFNSYKPDGKLLTHDEILYTLQVSPGSENHPFISQKEHPVLGIPFYHIHPCETSKLMKEVLLSVATNTANSTDLQTTGNSSDQQTTTNTDPQTQAYEMKLNASHYLLSWITIIAPVVGLRVPLLYYK